GRGADAGTSRHGGRGVPPPAGSAGRGRPAGHRGLADGGIRCGRDRKKTGSFGAYGIPQTPSDPRPLASGGAAVMNWSERSYRTLPSGLAGRLDPVCDRFESGWRAGEQPRLEDFLPLVDGADRPALLRELLALELEFRGQRGEQPSAAEYRLRLRDYAPDVEALF